MSLPAQRLLSAPAPNRGLLIPGLWWQPDRVAVYRRRWQTFRYPDYTPVLASAKGMRSLAVSPIGVDGLTHFVAWDVDSGRVEDVKAILAALPQGCRPLVSFSGKKGWHAWLFFDRPVATTKAKAFAKEVARAAGVRCEAFPSGENSRCLKWPGSLHPETRRQEVFVSPEDGHEYDTRAVLGLLASGDYRTPAGLLEKVRIPRVSSGFPRNPREGHPMGQGMEAAGKCEKPAEVAGFLVDHL